MPRKVSTPSLASNSSSSVESQSSSLYMGSLSLSRSQDAVDIRTVLSFDGEAHPDTAPRRVTKRMEPRAPRTVPESETSRRSDERDAQEYWGQTYKGKALETLLKQEPAGNEAEMKISSATGKLLLDKPTRRQFTSVKSKDNVRFTLDQRFHQPPPPSVNPHKPQDTMQFCLNPDLNKPAPRRVGIAPGGPTTIEII